MGLVPVGGRIVREDQPLVQFAANGGSEPSLPDAASRHYGSLMADRTFTRDGLLGFLRETRRFDRTPIFLIAVVEFVAQLASINVIRWV